MEQNSWIAKEAGLTWKKGWQDAYNSTQNTMYRAATTQLGEAMGEKQLEGNNGGLEAYRW